MIPPPPRFYHLLTDLMLCEFGFLPLSANLTEMDRLGTFHGFIYDCGKPRGPMRDLTLNRGNEENSIVASGTHYQYGYRKEYTLTGTTGPLEDGRVPVNLKIDYPTGWQGITLMGHFDPEESSLRGTVTWEDESVGEFVFKRDPDLVRFYPAPSTIDARARWKFATTVTLDRIQRQSWSPSYILKRIKDGKRYMQLAIWDEYYKRRLNDDERGEFDDLLSSLYTADARFYASRINIKLSEAMIQYVNHRSRDFCSALTPVNTDPYTATIAVALLQERESFVWIVASTIR